MKNNIVTPWHLNFRVDQLNFKEKNFLIQVLKVNLKEVIG